MRNQRYRRKRRQKLNAGRLFLVTVLFLLFLGFVVTQRSRNMEAEQGRLQQKVSEQGKDSAGDTEAAMRKILADERRYP